MVDLQVEKPKTEKTPPKLKPLPIPDIDPRAKHPDSAKTEDKTKRLSQESIDLYDDEPYNPSDGECESPYDPSESIKSHVKQEKSPSSSKEARDLLKKVYGGTGVNQSNTGVNQIALEMLSKMVQSAKKSSSKPQDTKQVAPTKSESKVENTPLSVSNIALALGSAKKDNPAASLSDIYQVLSSKKDAPTKKDATSNLSDLVATALSGKKEVTTKEKSPLKKESSPSARISELVSVLGGSKSDSVKHSETSKSSTSDSNLHSDLTSSHSSSKQGSSQPSKQLPTATMLQTVPKVIELLKNLQKALPGNKPVQQISKALKEKVKVSSKDTPSIEEPRESLDQRIKKMQETTATADQHPAPRVPSHREVKPNSKPLPTPEFKKKTLTPGVDRHKVEKIKERKLREMNAKHDRRRRKRGDKQPVTVQVRNIA